MSATTTLEIGRRLRLVAPDAPSRNDGRLEVVVPRGAFGSGEHETTAACLTLLEELPGLSGARVLDLGSGTGVLGIAAVRLGAASALLVDPAAGAAAAAAEAIRRNAVVDRVSCLRATLAAVGGSDRFEIILANVYADVLLAEAARLLELAAPGAAVVLSGIAWEQCFEVRSAFQQLGFQAVQERWGEEYVTLRLTAPDLA